MRMVALLTVPAGAALAMQPTTVELADFHVPTVAVFLAGLKAGRPALVPVRDALAAGDEEAASKAFCRYFRGRSLATPLWRDWGTVKRDPEYLNRASEDFLKGFIRGGYNVYHVPPSGIDWLKAPLVVLNSHAELRFLGLSFHHTRAGRYLDAIYDYVDGYMTAYPIEKYAGKNSTMGWVDDLTVGRPWRWGSIAERPIKWCPFIDLLRRCPEVSDERLLQLTMRLYQEVRYLRTQMPYWIARQHNAACRMILALAHACVLFDDFQESDEWLAFDVDSLASYIRGSFYADGVNEELTTAYYSSITQQMTLAATALKASPNVTVLKPCLEAMVAAIAALGRPTGTIPSFGDMRAGHFRQALHEPVLDWLDMRWADALFRGREGPEPPFRHWPVPGQEQWSGYYTMRSDWGPDARYMMLDGGPWGTTHQHGDRLSFVLTAYGADFVVDPTPTQYRSNESDAFISRQAFGFLHNTITVDGVDQFMLVRREGKLHWTYPRRAAEPLRNRWEQGERHILFVAEHSFTPLKDVVWERRVLFVDGRYWLLQDVLRGSPEAVEVEQNFQLEATVDVSIEGDRVTARAGNGAALVMAPIGTTLQPTVTTGDRGPHVSYFYEGQPSSVDSSQAGKPAIHGRGWQGRRNKLVPAPAVTWLGRVPLPAVLTLLLYPLPPGANAAGIPDVTLRQQDGETICDLPFPSGRVKVAFTPDRIDVLPSGR